jgi:hypothetical protein
MKLFAIRGEPLTDQRKQSLKAWLAKPELELLIGVIAARARLAEQEAIDQAHESIGSGITPDRSALIGSKLAQSQRFHGAVMLLEEIKSNPDGWQTVKLQN